MRFKVQCRLPGTRAGSLATPVLAFLCTVSGLHAAPLLDTVLANMDSAAAKWIGMRAQVQWVRYRSLVDDTSVESGRIAVRRAKSGSVEMLLEFTEPTNYFLSVRGAKVEIYKPKIKLVEEYDLSKSRDQLENALLIGFGTSGSYLSEHYDIAVDADEAFSGHPVVKLELEPKDPRGGLNNQRLEMWISTKYWQPVQQKIYESNLRDYRLYSYSEVLINPEFKSDEFKLRLERGTSRARPQR